MAQEAHQDTGRNAAPGVALPDFTQAPSITAAFESVVARHREKIAIEYRKRRVRYRGLDLSAARLSGRLRKAAGGSKARVAYLLEDRIHALVAILGTLRAGHAFVPLDAADPEERIRFILEDCEPVVLVTDEAHLEQARTLAPPGCKVFNLNALGVQHERPDAADVGPDDPAYIFYTSGSTGQPKGVCQTHRNLLHFVGCYSRLLGIGEADRLSLLYSLSFSAANMDVFGGLLAGATICAYDMRERGIPGLAMWLDRQAITVLHAVPTVFRKLADSLEDGRIIQSVRAIDLGGEAVTTRDVELWRAHFRPDCLLVNHLAATEASVIAQYLVDPARTHASDMLPVGTCPEGVAVRIEGPDGSEAATDEVGRMVVTSPFVSPGYWRRPDLNAAAFADDPARAGYRIFRTDDRGRIGPDGQLYFLGREGTRVKIRGHSVDLAEVEAAARRCPGVRDVAVVAGRREEGAEADVLIAHMVVPAAAQRHPQQLRQALASYLPQYMIPSAFVFPESLPMTSTGKVNRRLLEQMLVPPQDTAAEVPVDQLEAAVAAIFASILDRETVGRTDDFYLLGGDSLSSVELQIRLSDLIGRNVTVKTILRDPTVGGLAAALQEIAAKPLQKGGVQSVLLALQEHPRRPALFIVHGRRGHANVSPHFLGLLGKERAVYALQARGIDGIDPPHRTIARMAEDYCAAIATVQPTGPYALGGFCAGAYVAIEMARMLRAQGHQVLPLLAIDPPPPPFSAQFATREELSNVLHQLHEAGSIEKPTRLNAAVRVSTAFERALLTHELRPYGGEAFVLASPGRISAKGWGDRKILKSVFSGGVYVFRSMPTHGGMLDPKNETFAKHVRRYLGRIEELTASAQALPVSAE
jgi:amino acid adenylation domain-containing protein